MNPTQAWRDPVVAEIHKVRETLAEQYHNDLVAYSEAAQEHCRALGFKFASNRHREPSTTEAGAET